MGRSYYIGDSGMGNYSAVWILALILQVTEVWIIQPGEVDIEINFRTSADYAGNYMEFLEVDTDLLSYPVYISKFCFVTINLVKVRLHKLYKQFPDQNKKAIQSKQHSRCYRSSNYYRRKQANFYYRTPKVEGGKDAPTDPLPDIIRI